MDGYFRVMLSQPEQAERGCGAAEASLPGREPGFRIREFLPRHTAPVRIPWRVTVAGCGVGILRLRFSCAFAQEKLRSG